MSALRVLHCPTMVGGNPQGLAAAERKIGLDSWAVAFSESSFKYSSDEVLWSGKSSFLARELSRWGLLRRAIREFDIIHFNFGRSVMPHWVQGEERAKHIRSLYLRKIYGIYSRLFGLRDLPLLRRAGKGIVVTYQGSDARQLDYCRNNFEITFAKERDYTDQDALADEHRRRQISVFDKFADRIFTVNPDLLRVLPARARFMPYAHIDLEKWSSRREPDPKSAPLVVHAPTDRQIKGTRYIIEAVERLKSEGVAFEFALLEALAHDEARKTYERADLLVDQLLTGWYGGLAVEFMALGKPVICYIRQEDLKFIPEKMKEELPIINAEPKTVYSVLKEWLAKSKAQRHEQGKRGRAYVERWHDPLQVAAALKKEYEEIVSAKRRN